MVIYLYALGGLSSCIVTQMVLGFLNKFPNATSIGHHFMKFLYYYGYTFNNKEMSIINGEYIIDSFVISDSPDELVVMDMYYPEMNAAGSVTKFGEIRNLFRRVHDDIKKGDLSEIEWRKTKVAKVE